MNNNYINNLDLSKSNEIFTNIEPKVLSFDGNVFTKFKELNNTQRDMAQKIFKECLSYIDRIPKLKKVLKTFKLNSYSDALLSNLIICSSFPEYKNSINVKYGICSLLITMQKNKKRELKLVEDILFFNINSKSFSNKKLFKMYKNTFKNESIAMSLLNKDEYSKIYNESEILKIKRRDILNEFSKRTRVSKVCELVNTENIEQGKAYFIPKKDIEDEIIVFYKNEPHSMNSIKRKKLLTKKVDGKISWYKK